MGKVIAVLLTCFTVAVISMVLMVGAVNAAAPGDPLYSVDRQLEAVRMGLADTRQGMLNLQVELIAERMSELHEVAARGDLANFDSALTALEESLVAIEVLSATESLPQSTVSALIDRALIDKGALLDENDENDNDADDNTNINNNDYANTNDNGNTNDNNNTNDNGNINENPAYKHPRSGGNCGDEGDDSHPAAEKLGSNYGVSAGEVMDWFCGGYGFGEIALGYKLGQLNGVPVQEIFQLRADGMGWGRIMQQYGLIGKNKTTKNNGNSNGSAQPTPAVQVVPNPVQPTPQPVLQGPKNPNSGGMPSTKQGNNKPKNNGGGNGNIGNNGSGGGNRNNGGGNGGNQGGGNNNGGGKKP